MNENKRLYEDHEDEYIELPRDEFQRPPIPFTCKYKFLRAGKSAVVVCEFDDHLPMLGDNMEDLHGARVSDYVTTELFFDSLEKLILPPYKHVSRSDYDEEWFRMHREGADGREFITAFDFVYMLENTKNDIGHYPAYTKNYGKIPHDKLDEALILNRAKWMVRAVVADNPVVKIDKNTMEIIDGPF